MPKMVLVPLVALAAGCAAYAGGPASAEESAETQAKMEAALSGRVAGPPVNCVPSREIEGNTPLGSDLILFKARGNLVYLNQTRGACNLKPWAAYKRQTISSNMCRGEIIDVFDPRSGVPLGSCSLGDFTPYRRAD